MASWGQDFVDFENENVYESANMCMLYVQVVTYITLTHTLYVQRIYNTAD